MNGETRKFVCMSCFDSCTLVAKGCIVRPTLCPFKSEDSSTIPKWEEAEQ